MTAALFSLLAVKLAFKIAITAAVVALILIAWGRATDTWTPLHDWIEFFLGITVLVLVVSIIYAVIVGAWLL